MNQNYVLGIDAGATKTTAVIGTETSILKSGISKEANLHTTASKKIIKHLQLATQKALQQSSLSKKIKFQHIVIGIAGLDTKADYTKAQRCAQQALKPWLSKITNLTILNDIDIVLRSGTDQPYGIALIAGTGSHALGINRQGQRWQVSGLDYLLADEGSAYAVGLAALHTAAKSADHRTKKTLLEPLILKHFKVESIRDLLPLLYTSTIPKATIAQLATVVEAAAIKRDWCAQDILQHATTELILQVSTIMKQLHMQRGRYDIVVTGGMFQMQQYPFLKNFTTKISSMFPKAQVISPQSSPAIGAVKIAQTILKNSYGKN